MKKKWIIILLIGLVGFGAYHLEKEGSSQTKEKSLVEDNSVIQPVIEIQKGNLAPDFELATIEGKHIKLSELRGKRVIVNMWATWCPPCKEEVPELERFYEENHKDGIEMLAVDLTESEKNKGDVATFIKTFKITYPVVLDERGEVAGKYKVASIPATYLINAEGIIQQKYVGPVSYKTLKEAFDKMK